MKFILGGFFPSDSQWFGRGSNAFVTTNLSFVLMIGSGLGYYLFKDK